MPNPNALIAGARKAFDSGAKLLNGSSASLAAEHNDPTVWRAVTINASADRTQPLPAPLAAFGDRIETRTKEAPAGRGTELGARFTGKAGADDIADLRSALRKSKQLIEVGEVLVLNPVPHGSRSKTVTGKAIDKVDAHAGREGVL